jgi:hypothetical protein
MPQTLGSLRSDRKTVPHNEAAADPTVNDDSTAGYEIGGMWVNTTSDTCWMCTDASAGAAVWQNLTSTSGVSDGDKGDITVSGSGAVWTIDPNVVTFAKMQDVSAGDKVLGRISGAGDVEEIDCTAAGRALLDDANAAAQRTTLGLGTISTVNSPVPIADGGTGQTTQTAAFDALDPLTTQGDIIYHDGTNSVRLPKGTAGQVLRMNAGATVPEWGAGGGASTSQWTTIIKTSNTTIQSDATVNQDADLQFTTVANTNYLIRALIVYLSPAAADFKYIWTHGGTLTDSAGFSWRMDEGATTISNILGDADPFTGENLQTTTDGELNMIFYHLFMRVSGSGGLLALNWSQNSSVAGDTTVYAGSFIEYLSETP